MIKILFITGLFLCIFIPLVQGELIVVNNQTFSIELIIEPQCGELQENIFRIERLNYTGGMEAEFINYTTICNNKTTEIKKEIKKYTESKTGSCTFVESKNQTISLLYGSDSFFWNISIFCKTEEEIILQEILPTCFEDVELKINQRLFEKGEQITMDFFIDTNPDFLEITYWIETLKGDILKNKRTSANIDRKKHTFQTIKEPLQGAYVKAIFKDNCSEKETKQLILLQGEEVFEEELSQETVIEIKELKQTNNEILEATIHAQRGESRSSVISLKLLNEKGRTIYTEKITLEEKNSAILFKTILPTYNEKELKLIIEGLGLQDSATIQLEKQPTIELVRAYTKQKYYTNNLTWYVRTKQEGQLIIKIQNENNSIIRMVTGNEEKTTAIIIPYIKGEIHTTIINGEENITSINTPEVIREIIKKKKISTKKNLTIHNKTIQSQTIQMYKEPEEKEKYTFKRKALYGLFGTVIASSIYLLLKEQ